MGEGNVLVVVLTCVGGQSCTNGYIYTWGGGNIISVDIFTCEEGQYLQLINHKSSVNNNGNFKSYPRT